MIAIIDSGIANLRSVAKGFERVGVPARVIREHGYLRDATGVVLPGVGAFADGIATLEQGGFIEPLRRAIESGKPVLGICLGLHFLFSESEEFGLHKGMDLLRGRVRRFPHIAQPTSLGPQPVALKIPHMGWNQVHLQRDVPIMAGIPDGSYFYFVHSYYVDPGDDGVVAAVTEYGIRFTSMVWRDNLFATQFHPEKSQAVGLKLLANFGKLARA